MQLDNQVLQINIDDIIPNRFQPRVAFDEAGLNELAASIKEHGIIQPLVLRKLGKKYEIIAGERRYKAATIAGLSTVPAILSNIDDNASAEVALIENVQRRDLTAIEEARSYKNLLDKGYLTQDQLAKKMGLSQSAISNKLRLLNLDDSVQQALLENKISERHARSLLTLTDKEEQKQWLNKIINERMTVRQLDQALKNRNGGNTDPSGDVPLVQLTQNIEEMQNNATDINENKEKNIANLLVSEGVMTEYSDVLPNQDNSQPMVDESGDQWVQSPFKAEDFNEVDEATVDVVQQPNVNENPYNMVENPVQPQVAPVAPSAPVDQVAQPMVDANGDQWVQSPFKAEEFNEGEENVETPAAPVEQAAQPIPQAPIEPAAELNSVQPQVAPAQPIAPTDPVAQPMVDANGDQWVQSPFKAEEFNEGEETAQTPAAPVEQAAQPMVDANGDQWVQSPFKAEEFNSDIQEDTGLIPPTNNKFFNPLEEQPADLNSLNPFSEENSFTIDNTQPANNDIEIFDMPTGPAPVAPAEQPVENINMDQASNIVDELNPNNKFFQPVQESSIDQIQPEVQVESPIVNPMDNIDIVNAAPTPQQNVINMNSAIEEIRKVVEDLNALGLNINIDEADLDNSYQINITINK